MKKIIALALALFIVLGMVGCGAKEDKGSEETVLTMWCIATESDANHAAYEKAIAEYEAAHPGIKIEWEAFENQSYKTKIKAAMSDPETLPDIFFTWAGAFLGDFAEAGAAYCLDDAYAPHKSALPEIMLANSTYGGKHYGVPLTYNFVAMFANMDLLAQVGWDKVPETYEELTACCDALLTANIIPFGCAGKEGWCVTEYLEPIILKTIGYEALNDVFAGRATWNNEGIASAVDTMQDMIDKGRLAKMQERPRLTMMPSRLIACLKPRPTSTRSISTWPSSARTRKLQNLHTTPLSFITMPSSSVLP
ncbi:MAG: extracellular solute-binding protein [Lachnospiraceae bacterium]|nr:extracellular solute-binding protein [Lachnospiraceae bacterium]